MNIIIVGCGKVGEKLVEKLSEEKDNNITVVDLRANLVQEIATLYDVMGVVGSGANIDILKESGIDDADILIAVTGSDELNLLTCLIAKKTADCETIARVRNPDYNKEINMFKEDLGLAMIINPEQTAATEIARVLRMPTAIKIDTFARGRVEILKFRVPEGNVFDNLKLSDLSSIIKCDVLVCGVERGEKAIIPNGNFVIRANDLISVVISPENSRHLFKSIGIKTNAVNDTIIVGGGTTAYYLASKLIQHGIAVKIIEINAERCEELCVALPGATIIHADGTNNRTLLEEGIAYAESFVSLTNIDEENILLSLFAKSQMKGKLVTKINRIAYDDVITNLDLDTTIYPKNLTAEYIVRFVRAKKNSLGISNIETMHMILDGKAEALEFRIKENSKVTDVPLQDLSIKESVLIACIHRNGKIILPKGKDVIQTGDTVIVVTTLKGLKDISDILE